MKRSEALSLYLGIFLTSLSVIVLEIALTKIFSVTLWYHFAYFTVSLATFGIGAGGLVGFFLQDRLLALAGGEDPSGSRKAPLERVLTWVALAQAAGTVASLALLTNCNITFYFTLPSVLKLAVAYAVCAWPFTAAGMIFSLTLRRYADNAPRLYATDLIGSATGCLAFLWAITHFSGPSVVLLAALAALAASGSFYSCDPKSGWPLRVSAAVILAAAVLTASLETRIFAIKHTKSGYPETDVVFEKWSPLARITVYPGAYFQKDRDQPFGWGMSRNYVPKEPIDQLWVEQDASAGTPITRFDGDLSKLDFLRYDVTSLPYHVKPCPKVFIIGVGGGRDALTALVFGSPSVVACDINPVIVGLVKDRYREFAGDLYGRPGVHAEVAEARNSIRRKRSRFDLIQISLIDSWAATTAGAFSLAENSLYTVEAFVDYLDHLEQGGMLSVTRYLFTPRNQSLRVVVLARKALETLGIPRPEDHVAVVGTSKEQGLATVLVKKAPFTDGEIDAIARTADRMAFEALYLPGRRGDPDFDAALRSPSLEQFTRTSFYDLRPSTDDRPFFFQMVYFSAAFRTVFGKGLVGQTFNYYAPRVVAILMVVSSAFVLLFYVVPLVASSKVQSLPKSWGLYFILLGLGFMLVEIPLIQKGSLYLGHPTYGFSIVLFSMLIFSGAGSYLSGRISAGNLMGRMSGLLLAASLLVVLTTASLDWLVPRTIGLSLAARIAVIVLFAGATALVMGTAFPTGIRQLGQSCGRAIPWAWALNGGASVLGSIIAMAIAMSAGYRLTLLAGAGAYLAASAVAYGMHRQAALRCNVTP